MPNISEQETSGQRLNFFSEGRELLPGALEHVTMFGVRKGSAALKLGAR